MALSTVEAEYMALARAAQEAVWLQRMMYDLNKQSINPVIIYEDNQCTICMVKNPQFHGRAKHIDIKFHYIREQIAEKKIELK